MKRTLYVVVVLVALFCVGLFYYYPAEATNELAVMVECEVTQIVVRFDEREDHWVAWADGRRLPLVSEREVLKEKGSTETVIYFHRSDELERATGKTAEIAWTKLMQRLK